MAPPSFDGTSHSKSIVLKVVAFPVKLSGGLGGTPSVVTVTAFEALLYPFALCINT